MIWNKLKKIMIPLIIVKLLIFVFFIFMGDSISISRDNNYSINYQEGFDNDTTLIKKQKLIRIVRNEDEHGISIKLRGRKNITPLLEKQEKINQPIVD